MLDRDIPNKTYNNYLKKYSKQYQIKRNEDDIWVIKCKFGAIQPDSVVNSTLLFEGSFTSSRKKGFFLKRIPSFCKLFLDCEREIIIKFPEARLAELIDVLQVRKRKQISEEQRRQLTYRLANARAAKTLIGKAQNKITHSDTEIKPLGKGIGRVC